MSKRDPFLYSFQSPYDIPDTIDAFLQVIEGLYAQDRIQVKAYPRGQAPLVNEVYAIHPDDQAPNIIEIRFGTKARTHFAAIVTLQKNAQGTLGEVKFDRPKKDVWAKEAAQIRSARIYLQGQGGFRILRQDV